jgi:lysyl-tRNA synthetase class 2
MTTQPEVSEVLSEDVLMQARREKRSQWTEKGIDAYPTADGLKPSSLAKDIHLQFGSLSKEELEAKNQAGGVGRFSVAGRVLLHRSFGKATFLTIQDRSSRIQIYAQTSKLPPQTYEMIKHLDLGDIVFAEGTIFKTKTGELTIDADKFQLMTKNVKPLPEKFHGLQDIEARYRHRYLDLISNEESRRVFILRSEIIRQIREFFYQRDYLEVETPMLHPLVGGAAARPFETFHNTLKMKLFLRIAPELYLKRLVVGGLDRVFEINRCFRNEGISIKHNPEFTMLEFYEAFATYHDLMAMTEVLIEAIAIKLMGRAELEYQGARISLKAPFARMTIADAIAKTTKVNPQDENVLRGELKKKGIELKSHTSLAEVQFRFFEEFVEEHLIQPTYIMDHPIEISPLARRSSQRPDIAERFELYIAGREVANGFNELNDPDDQASRFHDQLKRKAAGDEEASDFDEDYIQALQVGLPPTAGEGIGIDRLVMLFANVPSIRDVILFPQLRSTHHKAEESHPA